jgi:hypothetical protein
MEILNLTDLILDKFGFSEYWNDNGDSGTRTLTFSDGTILTIVEVLEHINDDNILLSNHYCYLGYKAIPKNSFEQDLYFLHDLFEIIELFYSNCMEEFIEKCKELKIINYIESYLNYRQ